MHFKLALAKNQCQMHYEIRSQKSSSSDRRQRGRAVTREVTSSRPRAI